MPFTGQGTQSNPYIIHSWDEFEAFVTSEDIKAQTDLFVKWADSDNKIVDFKHEKKRRIIQVNNIIDMNFNGWTFTNIVTGDADSVSGSGRSNVEQLTLIFGNRDNDSPIYIRNGTFIYSRFGYGYPVYYDIDKTGLRAGFGSIVEQDDSEASYIVSEVRKPVFYLITRQNGHRNLVYLDNMHIYVNCVQSDDWGRITIIESTCNFLDFGNTIRIEANPAIYICNSSINITHNKLPHDFDDSVYFLYDYYMCVPTLFLGCEININIPMPKCDTYKVATPDYILRTTDDVSIVLFSNMEINGVGSQFIDCTINIISDDFVDSNKKVGVYIGASSTGYLQERYENALENTVINFNNTNVWNLHISSNPLGSFFGNSIYCSVIIFSKNGTVYLDDRIVSKPSSNGNNEPLLWVHDEYLQDYDSLKHEYNYKGVILDDGNRMKFSETIPIDMSRKPLISNPLINNGKPVVPFDKYPICESSKLNRSVNAKFNKFVPEHIKYAGSDIQFLYNESRQDYPIWQSSFEPLYNNQTYGNWLNCLATDVDSRNLQRQIVSTFQNYKSSKVDSTFVHIWDGSNKTPGEIVTINSLDYGNVSGYSFSPKGLNGLTLSNTDSIGLQYFRISKEYLNLLNFTIAIISDITNVENIVRDSELHYLFTLPISTDSDNNFMFYVADKFVGDKLVYVTNINEKRQEQIIEINNTSMSNSSCCIFIITCNPTTLSLYVNDIGYSNSILTDCAYKPDVIQKDGTIGYFDELTNSWNNNFLGNVLTLHLFSQNFNRKYIWKLFTKCRHIIYKSTDNYEDDSSKLLSLKIIGLPDIVTYFQGNPIRYKGIKVEAEFSIHDIHEGIQDISDSISYSIPEGEILEDYGDFEITVSYTYNGITLTDSFNIVVYRLNPIKLTRLDPETLELTNDITWYYDGYAASNYMKANPDNLYDLTVMEDYIYPYLSLAYLDNLPQLYSIYLSDAYGQCASFNNCINLTKVRLPKNLKSVFGFQGTSLIEIDIPETVYSINTNAFRDCKKLQRVICHNTEGEPERDDTVSTNVNDYAFYGCSALTTVELPKAILFINGKQIFTGCTALKTVTLPAYLEGIKSRNMFEGCFALTSVNIPDTVSDLDKEVFYGSVLAQDVDSDGALYHDSWLIRVENDKLTEYVVREGTEHIASYAFELTPNLTSLTLPTTLKSMCNNSVRIAFAPLETLIIPSLHTLYWDNFPSYTNNVQLKNLHLGKDYMVDFITPLFNICHITIDENNPLYTMQNGVVYDKDITKVLCVPTTLLLTNSDTLEFPNSVDTIGTYAIYNVISSNIPNIIIPNNITTIEEHGITFCTSNITIEGVINRIGAYAFSGSTSPESIRVDTDELTAPAFSGAYYTKHIELSGNIKVIPEITFSSCTYLTDVTIPDSVEVIGRMAFDGCRQLSTVKLPENLKLLGESVFEYSGITNIDIPEGPVNIPRYTFSWCANLSMVDIPSTVATINKEAFTGCSDITINIHRYPGTISYEPWGATNATINWLGPR